jgi:hypothetical protein
MAPNRLNHSVLIKFRKEYDKDKVWAFYNSFHPIWHRSGGGVVMVINSDPWLDFYNVEPDELTALITYLDNQPKDLRDNIYIRINFFHTPDIPPDTPNLTPEIPPPL